MLPIHTILHPTDLSPNSKYAFELASALAHDYQARLVLLYVKEPAQVAFGEFGAFPLETEEITPALKEKLEELRPTDAALRVEHRFCYGDPTGEILALAHQTHCDLIVMGSHGRTGLGRVLMGSVAEAVLRKAPCPVLTVRVPIHEADLTADEVPGEPLHAANA